MGDRVRVELRTVTRVNWLHQGLIHVIIRCRADDNGLGVFGTAGGGNPMTSNGSLVTECINIYIRPNTSTRKHTNTHTHTHTHARTHTTRTDINIANALAHVRTHIRKDMHIRTYTANLYIHRHAGTYSVL